MIRNERADMIMSILKEKKYATVGYLAEHVYASQVTIRRDLKAMEDMGLLIRSYGGATLVDNENRSVPLVIREHDSSSEKSRIAREAVALITKGSTVFMDGSSTVLRMVSYFEEGQHITVVTNSLRVASLLCDKKIPVYCTGGLLVSEAQVCIGSYAEALVRSMTVDMMFFSSMGFSADGRITDFSESETNLRRLMLSRARRKYFLCDSSKLGKSFLFTVCTASEVDGILSDRDAAAWLREQREAERGETRGET